MHWNFEQGLELNVDDDFSLFHFSDIPKSYVEIVMIRFSSRNDFKPKDLWVDCSQVLDNINVFIECYCRNTFIING